MAELQSLTAAARGTCHAGFLSSIQKQKLFLPGIEAMRPAETDRAKT